MPRDVALSIRSNAEAYRALRRASAGGGRCEIDKRVAVTAGQGSGIGPDAPQSGWFVGLVITSCIRIGNIRQNSRRKSQRTGDSCLPPLIVLTNKGKKILSLGHNGCANVESFSKLLQNSRVAGVLISGWGCCCFRHEPLEGRLTAPGYRPGTGQG